MVFSRWNVYPSHNHSFVSVLQIIYPTVVNIGHSSLDVISLIDRVKCLSWKYLLYNSHTPTTLTHTQNVKPSPSDSPQDASLSRVPFASASHALLDTNNGSWLAGWLAAQPKAQCKDWTHKLKWKRDTTLRHGPSSVYHVCTILTSSSLVQTQTELREGGQRVEKQCGLTEWG